MEQAIKLFLETSPVAMKVSEIVDGMVKNDLVQTYDVPSTKPRPFSDRHCVVQIKEGQDIEYELNKRVSSLLHRRQPIFKKTPAGDKTNPNNLWEVRKDDDIYKGYESEESEKGFLFKNRFENKRRMSISDNDDDESDKDTFVDVLPKKRKLDEDNGDCMGTFVVDDETIEYESDNEDKDGKAVEISFDTEHPLERFKLAMCLSNHEITAAFFADLIATKLKVALDRGHKMNAARLDDLITFVCSSDFQQCAINPPFKAICNICNESHMISMLFHNSKDHILVSELCGTFLNEARASLVAYYKTKSEVTEYLKDKFQAFNELNLEKPITVL